MNNTGTLSSFDLTNYDATKLYLTSVSGIVITTNLFAKATDSNGQANVSYDSKGTGDLNIKIECMNLVKTYDISDRLYYWYGLEDRVSDFTLGLCEGGTVGSVTFDSSNGLHFYKGSKATLDRIEGVPLPTNCEIEAIFASRNGGTMGIGLTNGNGNADICIIDGNTIAASYRYTNSAWKGSILDRYIPYGSETYPITMKLVKQDKTCYCEVNGVKSSNFTMQFSSDATVYTGIGGNSNLNCYIIGFSIKPL